MATSTLASLIVSLTAETASFNSNMTRSADVTAKAMSDIKSAASIAGAALGGLASAFTVGAALDWAKQVVASASALDDLADSTGSSVENLSKLANQAKISGVGFDTMATLVNRMAAGMGGADEKTTKVKAALEALGVSAKDPAEAVFEVARKLEQYADGTNKAALAAQIFGKQGPGFLAMLKDMAKGQEAVATITTQQAAEAEKLEQSLRRLTAQGSIFATSLLSDVVPALNRTLTAFNAARGAGLGFWDALNAPNTAEQAVDRLALWQSRLAKVQEQIAYAEKFKGPGFANDLRAEAAALEAKVAAYQKLKVALMPDYSIFDKEKIKPQAPTIPVADTTKVARQAIADYRDEIQKLNDDMAKLAGTDGGYSHLIAANQKYQEDLRAGKVINEEQVRLLMQTAVAADQQAIAAKALAEKWEGLEKSLKAAAEWERDIDEAIMRANMSIKAQNDALELEHDTLGMTDNARAQYITRLALEKAQIDGNTNAVLLLTKQLDLLGQKAADTAFLDMAKAAQQSFMDAAAFASDFFMDLFNNGSKAFKNLWDSFKQLAFRAIADIAARQLVLSLTGAVGLTGAGAAGAAGFANAGGGGGLAGLASNFSSLSSLSNLGNIGSTIGTIGAAYSAGAAGISAAAIGASEAALYGGVGAGAAVGAGGVGAGLTAGLSAGLAAVPVAGWAALAALVVYKIWKGMDNGPAMRTGTFASGDLGNDPSRDAAFSGASAFGKFGFSKDFWLNPDDKGAGAAFGQLATSITAIDNAIAKMVGGDLTKEIAATLASHTITVGLGKEHTDLAASGGLGQILKDRYVTVLTTIDERLGSMVQAFQGTGDELANFVVSLVSLRETLGSAFDKLDADSITALGAAFGGIDKLASSLSYLNANFVAEADKTVAAQQQLVDSFSELGLAVPATHRAFLDLLSSFDLTTESGRSLYASVMGLSGAFVEVNGTATQAMAALRTSLQNLEQARAAYLGTPQSTVMQNQVNLLVGQFAGGRAWAQDIVNASGVTGLVQTLSQIVQSDFANYSTSDQSLITQILSAAAAMRDQGGAGGAWGAPTPYGSSPPGYTPYVPPIEAAAAMDPQAMADEMMRKFADLVGQSTGDYGQKIALQMRLVTGAMAGMANNPAMAGVAALLYNNNIALGSSLKLFESLSTRYSDSIAEQLVKLTESYNKQVQDLQGNAEGLDVLNIIFEEQWQSIINGTAAGVDGTMAQLKRLQQGILDYVDGLKIGSDSPLTAMQKLAEARSQYESDLSKAGMGDQKALGDITGSADAYIKLARDFYASSSAYTDIFNQITGDLTALGTKDFGGGDIPLNAADQALLSVLPIGSTLMSALDMQDAAAWMANAAGNESTGWRGLVGGNALPPSPGDVATSQDIKEMASQIIDAIMEAALISARASSDDAGMVSNTLDRTKAALVDAFNLARK